MRNTPKSRRLPRRLVVPLAGAGAAAILAAGCGGTSHPSSAPTSASAPGSVATAPTITVGSGGSTTTTPATTAPPAATTTAPISTAPSGSQACATAELTLSLGQPNGAAGSTYVTLTLTNVGASTCTVDGYPGVSYVSGSNGTQVGASAQRDPASPSSTVTLPHGQSAHSQVRIVNPYDFNAAACKITPVQGFRIYPPGQTTAGFVRDPGNACSSRTLPSPTLFVGAVQAG